jgi:hypothetical protein
MMSALSKPTLALTIVLLAAPSSTAQAETINYVGLGPASIVKVAGIQNGTFWAGQLNWEWAGGGDLYTYCVDIMNALNPTQEVAVGTTNEIYGMAPEGGAKAAWLYNTYAETVAKSGNAILGAALQVAIWEALYDPFWSLSAGKFILVTTGAIETAANSYLATLYHGSGYYTGTATWLNTNGGQDQMTRSIAVPEPSVMLLFGCSLLLLATARRAAGRARVRI